MTATAPNEPARSSAGARAIALQPRQAALFDTLLPRLALDLAAPAPADLRALFDDVDEVRLESGFGGGEHLIAEAERHPRTGFIGIEPFVNGMAKALAAIDERKLDNIRLHHGDATDMLAWLPAASLVAVRSALSRSVAEAAALEAALRAGRKRRGDRAARCGRAANSASPATFPITSPGR